jgi:signal transduction histidine kinase
MGETEEILLVNADKGESTTIEAALVAAGYRVKVVSTIAEAIEAISKTVPDAIVIGGPPSPFVLLTQDVVPALEARHPLNGASGPAGAHELVETVRRCLGEARDSSPSGKTGPVPVLPASSLMGNILSRLTSETVRIQEEERRKLSLELHDEIAQLMGNLVLMMGACLAVAPEDAEELRRYLLQARETAKEGFHRVRRFSIDLRPPMLDDLGLAPTILWYAERFAQDNQIPVDVKLPDRLPALNGEQETGCFRIIQQALQNVRQHARASRVDVTVESVSGWLLVTIADDGVGIDQRELGRKLAEGTHLGLAGMRFRAELLGGRLDFVSAPGKGTTVVAEIPVQPAA